MKKFLKAIILTLAVLLSASPAYAGVTTWPWAYSTSTLSFYPYGPAFKVNAGIGTTTPAWAFQIATSSTSSTMRGQLALTDVNATAGANLKHLTFANESGNLYISSANDLLTSTTTLFTILNSGNVGIGTTSPGSLLSIGNTTGWNFSTGTTTSTSSGGLEIRNGVLKAPCFTIDGVTCLTSGSGTVTSIATNNGLTGGTITTTGTLGLDTSAIVNGLVLQYNGSRLAATGTPTLTVGNLVATTTLASQFPNSTTTQATFTGPFYDSTNSAGTSGNVWTSQGANVAPHWAAVSAGSTIAITSTTSDNFTFNVGGTRYSISTTTPINTGETIFYSVACSMMSSHPDDEHLRVSIGNPGGGTTTGATTYSSNSTIQVLVTLTGAYTSTTTGMARFEFDQESSAEVWTPQICYTPSATFIRKS